MFMVREKKRKNNRLDRVEQEGTMRGRVPKCQGLVFFCVSISFLFQKVLINRNLSLIISMRSSTASFALVRIENYDVIVTESQDQ